MIRRRSPSPSQPMFDLDHAEKVTIPLGGGYIEMTIRPHAAGVVVTVSDHYGRMAGAACVTPAPIVGRR